MPCKYRTEIIVTSNSSLSISQFKWKKLRAFLIEETLEGNATAWKLLEEIPKNTGEVSA